MLETRLDLYDETMKEIQEHADKAKVAVTEYIAHVFDGGDVDKLPSDARWWHHPVTPFAERIVNAYRVSQGKVVNPFHPNGRPYKLFDKLVDANGDWLLGKDLRKLISNQLVGTYLDGHKLEKAGWVLETAKISGKVHYRLVRVQVPA